MAILETIAAANAAYAVIKRFAENGRETANLAKSVGQFLQAEDDLREQVSKALDANTAVSLNMSDVSYIDSSGVAALIESKQKAEEGGKDFKIIKPSEAVTSVLQMAKLDTFFIIEN